MGNVLCARTIPSSDYAGLMKPIVFCSHDEAFLTEAVSLNFALTQKLASVRPKRRTMCLASCFIDVLNTLPDNVVIKDFDVMFNPEYKVDVLQIMILACKTKPFRIIWPGTYEDGKLVYAEDGYQDYKVFIVNNYDITCII